MRNTLIISIELDKLPLAIRNKIMSEFNNFSLKEEDCVKNEQTIKTKI